MKEVLYHRVLKEMSDGKSPSQICKIHNLKRSSVQNVVDKLKKQGVVKKIGYGVWEVNKEVLTQVRHIRLLSTSHQIRGHAFNWKIEFLREIDWLRRLEKFNIPYQLVGFQKIPRIIINTKKIWLTKKGLIIYESKDFFNKNSISSKGSAVFELDKTIKEIAKKLQIDLIPYKFTTLREHYALIKNELARQYNDKGEKLYIRDDGKCWMWIDYSKGEHELESNEVILNKKIQEWYNDQKKYNFEVTPTFILSNLNSLIEDRRYWAKHQKSHVKAIQTLSHSVIELMEEIKRLKGIIDKR